MNAFVSAQAVESCYRANINSFSSTTLCGNPASLTLGFDSTTLLSGPDVGVNEGEINFHIFGGNVLTASYDNGSVLVNGFVAADSHGMA